MVRRRTTQYPVSFATNFTWLLEADQPHQHCSSNHPAPALGLEGCSAYVHGVCAIHVRPHELCGTASCSAGGLHAHMQPWPLLSELLDDEHNGHEEVPGKLETFQAKGECLAYSQPPNCGSPGDVVVMHALLAAHQTTVRMVEPAQFLKLTKARQPSKGI